MTALQGTDTASWTERARALAPVIERHREESERERHMARPIFEAIREAGLLDMLVPASLGGPQAGYEDYLRVVEELSCLDGSAGWNVMIWAAKGLFADYLPNKIAAEIVGLGKVVCGAISPTGQAVPEPGGYRVSGRWAFASGCHYADWLIAAFTVMDGEAPRILDNGAPDMRAAFLPASECTIVDTWHVAGLRGTGSHDFEVAGVFVSEEHVLPMGLFFSGPPEENAPIYRVPFLDIASPQLPAVGLGIAREAIDAFKALAVTKTPTLGSGTLAGLHTMQDRVGRAEGLLRSARAYNYETVRDALAVDKAGLLVGDDYKAALRLAAAHSAKSAVDAVDLVFEAAGGSSIYESNRLEHCFRDVHMVTHHMMSSPMLFDTVGQYLLGGPLVPRR